MSGVKYVIPNYEREPVGRTKQRPGVRLAPATHALSV